MNRALKHRLEATAAAVVAAAVRPLPRRAALAFGRGLGRLLGALDRRHIAIAVENLRPSFPDWPGERLHATAHEMYAHFGAVLLDILWLDRRAPDDIARLVEITGAQHMEAALAAGRGVVLVTAHIGNWEMHGLAHAHRFGPIAVLARPLDNRALDARLCAFRERAGNSVVYKHNALGRLLRILRGGGTVAVLIDQNVQPGDGIFVDFFGRPAATTTVAAALAVKTGSLLLPCRTEMKPDGRYRLVYDPALPVDPGGERVAEIGRLTQALTTIIEGWVRASPTQWLWMHRRWKTRPPGEGAAGTSA